MKFLHLWIAFEDCMYIEIWQFINVINVINVRVEIYYIRNLHLLLQIIFGFIYLFLYIRNVLLYDIVVGYHCVLFKGVTSFADKY